MNYAQASDQLIDLARHAGAEILRYRNTDRKLDIQTKSDRTPLTAADVTANDILADGLAALYPDIPILSEESTAPPFAERQSWQRLWIVDPLDGTRDFLEGGDNFCINIALVENGEARFGLIYLPLSDSAYWGGAGAGAWRMAENATQAIHCRKLAGNRSVTFVASRRRRAQQLLEFEQRLAAHFAQVDRLGIGSAIKFCRIAEGAADIYPCFGPTYEWDTAAGQALIEAAGGRMYNLQKQPFRYNRSAGLLNGGFYVVADPRYDWSPLLSQQP